MQTISAVNQSDSDFDRFLDYAGQKSELQCLCAVVCEAAFLEAGDGISLSPVTCIDKPMHQITCYQDVINAGGLLGQDWDVMCVTVLSSQGDVMPTAIETNKRLDVMLELIRQGRADQLVIFARNEEHIRL